MVHTDSSAASALPQELAKAAGHCLPTFSQPSPP